MRQSIDKNMIRHPSIEQRTQRKMISPSGLNFNDKNYADLFNHRHSSKNIKHTQNKTPRSRKSTIDCKNLKKYQFVPIDNISALKQMLKKTIQIQTQTYIGNDKIKGSSLYKKLQLQFQNLKRHYQKEVQNLKNQLNQLDQQISNQKKSIFNLTNKRDKMDSDIFRLNEQLVQLQEKNYQMYWDVAAQLNNQADQYQQLLQMQQQIGSVSKGLSQKDVQTVVKKYQKNKNTTKSFKQTSIKQDNAQQNCCICCFDIKQSQQSCSLPCGHSHHTSCIKQWLVINKVCPLCRCQIVI